METFRISASNRETCIGSVWIRDGLDYILTGRLRSKIVGVFGMVTGNSMDGIHLEEGTNGEWLSSGPISVERQWLIPLLSFSFLVFWTRREPFIVTQLTVFR